MATKGLETAVMLYRCETLTLGQAATYAGQDKDRFTRTLETYGVPSHD